MKHANLLVSALFGVLLLQCGCARSVLQSSKLPDPLPVQGTQIKMVYCLPKGMIHFRRQPGSGGSPEVTVETVFVPDAEKYYTLEYLPNRTYEETVAVSVTEEMLLKKIDITSKPKIGEILMKVFELSREIAKFSVLPPSRAPGMEPEKYCDVMIDPKMLLDKKSAAKCKALNQRLDQLNYDLEKQQKELEAVNLEAGKQKTQEKETTWRITGLNQAIQNTWAEIAQLKSGARAEPDNELARICNNCGIACIKLEPLFPQADWEWLSVSPPAGGIKYRPLLPYRLEIQLSNNFIVKTIYLPNEAPVITLDITRPAWADQVTSLSFEKGVLTQATLTRPSETLAFVKIPVDLVKAIVGLPMDLIKFRVENITQGSELLQAQINELKLKQELLELKQKNK